MFRCYILYSIILHLGFLGGSAGEEFAYNVGDLGSIPGLGRSPGEGNGYPLQYSGLENSMDCIVHGVPKSQTPLSDFHFHITLNSYSTIEANLLKEVQIKNKIFKLSI